jgi:hypothetical protein
MMQPAADPDALRALVRETLMEVLLELRPQNGRPSAGAAPDRAAPERNGVPPAPALPADPMRIERGALTEKLVTRAAQEGRRVVLGSRALATPLALDKARSLGVNVERTD